MLRMIVRVGLSAMTRDIRDLRDLRDLRGGAIIYCPRPRFSLLGPLCLLARSVIVTLPLHKITYSCTNIMDYKNVTRKEVGHN